MTAVEFGPARYRIVYADGRRGGVRTLDDVLRMLRNDGGWREGHHPVRVEPVVGTQYRATYDGGAPGAWHNYDAGTLYEYLRAIAPVTRLELRSPVRP